MTLKGVVFMHEIMAVKNSTLSRRYSATLSDIHAPFKATPLQYIKGLSLFTIYNKQQFQQESEDE